MLGLKNIVSFHDICKFSINGVELDLIKESCTYPLDKLVILPIDKPIIIKIDEFETTIEPMMITSSYQKKCVVVGHSNLFLTQ